MPKLFFADGMGGGGGVILLDISPVFQQNGNPGKEGGTCMKFLPWLQGYGYFLELHILASRVEIMSFLVF